MRARLFIINLYWIKIGICLGIGWGRRE